MKLLLRLLGWLLILLFGVELLWQLTSIGQHRYLQHRFPQLPWPALNANSLLLGMAARQQQFPALAAEAGIWQQQLDQLLLNVRGTDTAGVTVSEGEDVKGSDSIATAALNGHPGWDLCLLPHQRPKTEIPTQSVYRWVDEHGGVHFGDRQGVAGSQDLSDQYASQRKLLLDIEFVNSATDKALELQLEQQAELLYRIVTQLLPAELVVPLKLQIFVYPERKDFRQVAEGLGMAANVIGFYSPAENRMHLGVQQWPGATLALARHEMTHALLANLVGTTPVWFNEGLAEYMERLQFQMNSASVALEKPMVSHLIDMQQKSPELVTTTLMQPPQEFYANGIKSYPLSFALVYFLNRDSAGQLFVRELIADVAKAPCDPGNRQQALYHYSGGAEGLATDFRGWLLRRPSGSQRY